MAPFKYRGALNIMFQVTITFGIFLANLLNYYFAKIKAAIISSLTADKYGRKKLFLEGGIKMFVCQVAMTIAIGSKFGTSGSPCQLPMWFSTLVVIAMCFYIAGFGWSWGPLGWLVQIFLLLKVSTSPST
ncbi:hypothetical protein CRYUN_Cryun19dG0129600 [Craigia yunnanensis]